MQKKALVIGGTRGLGLQIAYSALYHGAGVVVTGRNPQNADIPKELWAAKLDIGNWRATEEEKDVLHPFEFALVADTIILSAGTFLTGPVQDATDEQIEDLVRTHVTGPSTFFAHLLRCRESNPLTVVVVSSTAAHKLTTNPFYAMCQSAKATLARHLAVDLHAKAPGSSVLLVCPGGMNTAFFAGTPIEEKKETFMDPAEVANLIWGAVGDPELERLGFRQAYIEKNVGSDDPQITYEIRTPETPLELIKRKQ